MSNNPAPARAPMFAITGDVLHQLGNIGERLNLGKPPTSAELAVLACGLLPAIDELLHLRCEQDAQLRRLVDKARAEGPNGPIAQILFLADHQKT